MVSVKPLGPDIIPKNGLFVSVNQGNLVNHPQFYHIWTDKGCIINHQNIAGFWLLISIVGPLGLVYATCVPSVGMQRAGCWSYSLHYIIVLFRQPEMD